MTIGEIIDKLIKENLKIWHNDYDIRRGKAVDNEEKALTFLRSRVHNANRAEIKYELDKATGSECVQDLKVNYYKGDKENE